MAEDPDYSATKARFVDAAQTMPIRDDAFLSDAVMVFCMETLMNEPAEKTPAYLAALAIAKRLMAIPDDDTAWRVTFPYPWMSNEDLYTEKDHEHRRIALEAMELIDGGMYVTHAFAKVAARIISSADKVKKAYYAYEPSLRRMKSMVKKPEEK